MMILVSVLGLEATSFQFLASALVALLMFAYTFTLPHCPVSKSEGKGLVDALGLRAFALFKQPKMALFFIFSMLLGVCLQITNGFANPYLGAFNDVAEYAGTFGVTHSNILISVSKKKKKICILLIPFALKRFGIRNVMLIAMCAWVLRFALLGFGNPGSGVWLFLLSMIVYGVAFDFFNVSGSLFVDQETDDNIRSSAQGVFMMMTNGLGSTIGMLVAGEIVNYYQIFSDIDPVTKMNGWYSAWAIFAYYALAVAIMFMIVFKYKHTPEKLENINH